LGKSIKGAIKKLTVVVYKWILRNAKLRIGKRLKNIADWENLIKEVKVHIALFAISEELFFIAHGTP
jgi:cobalamin biosynthesis Co2+ chelatase CbiK